MAETSEKTKYRVLTPAGLDWFDKHADRGEVRDDLAASSISWLLLSGMVEEVTSVENQRQGEGEEVKSDG